MRTCAHPYTHTYIQRVYVLEQSYKERQKEAEAAMDDLALQYSKVTAELGMSVYIYICVCVYVCKRMLHWGFRKAFKIAY